MTAPRIFVYNADNGGCGFYRILGPAQALISQGVDVHIINPEADPHHQIRSTFWNNDDGTRVLLKIIPPECDIVVLQRPLTDWTADCIPMLQAVGIKVVVEIDDDFENISPRNVSWRNVQPKNSPQRNHLNLRRACQFADLVVVSTPALAAIYGAHGRVAVVPNCVPEWYLWTSPTDRWDGVRVGWSGSIDTHPDDLQVTRGGVAKGVRAAGAGFHVIGTGKGVQRALNLPKPPTACGWQPLDLYPMAMAAVDVGIVPLEPSAFNEAKSALKMMEFAALGVPVVASPTSENMRMFLAGIGLLAERPKDWEVLVRRLASSADERAELAERGREVMAAHTIEGNAGRWLDAWGSVVNTRAASSAA